MHPITEELHRSSRIGWLRAAVLGANDGSSEILVAGVAGLVAGAMSMAAGEYVSVSSQSDTEQADLQRERKELETQPEFELKELSAIYVQRGVQPELAMQVAEQLMAHDALGTHAREELGISELTAARPIQAAMASAGTFAVGAAMPLLVAWLAPQRALIWMVIVSSLVFLAALGGWGAQAGGAKIVTGAWRVTFWGAIAMALTAAVGWMFGATV
jgi:VIT1/CCC1 family predicted Fe2+/Mn2+ transporter